MNGLMWIKSPSIDTVPNFKKEIHLKKKLKKATLSISSMGFYRAYINDVSVTSNVFMPGWTSYLNRVQYQVYDVTKLLSEKGLVFDPFGTTGGVGIEPFTYALCFIIFDTLFIFIKNQIIKIYQRYKYNKQIKGE